MTNTLHLGMPFIEGSQAQKHITHNEALRILDAAIQIGVLDRDQTSPPLTPTEGDRHIVAIGATGAWAGQDDAVTTYEDGAWRYLTPKLGWCAWSDADGALLVYDGTGWTEAAGGGFGTMSGLTKLGINGTASDPNRLTVRSNAALFNAVDAADGGTGDMRVQISKEGSANTASVVFSNAFSGRAEFGLVESDAFKLKVSNDGSTFVEAITFDQDTGNAALQRGLALTGVISPSQIASAQNDYAPTDFEAASTLRLSSDTSRNITGLAGGADGRTVIVHNVGSQEIVLTNQDAASTAANRFLLGGNVTLAADTSLSLRYDGTTQRWRSLSPTSSGGGGGGALGMTDSERQNSGLNLIYQSKSFAEYRRLVNLFATGFKGASDALNGVLTGSSSNYTVTPGTAGAMTGNVAPTNGADTRLSGATPTMPLGGIAANINDNSTGTGATTASLGNLAAAAVGSRIVAQLDLGAVVTVTKIDVVGASVSSAASAANGVGTYYSTNGTSWTQAGAGYTVTTSPTNFSRTGSFAARYIAYVISAEAWGSITATIQDLNAYYQPVSNMTLVTATQTTDASVSNSRALIEFDNSANPTLGTDLTVEVTCNGGANWTAATLSAVTSNGQGGRKVAETGDQACTSGTSFAARIKTLNNKMVPIYGVTVSAH